MARYPNGLRGWSAKPLIVGSIPTRASTSTKAKNLARVAEQENARDLKSLGEYIPLPVRLRSRAQGSSYDEAPEARRKLELPCPPTIWWRAEKRGRFPT